MKGKYLCDHSIYGGTKHVSLGDVYVIHYTSSVISARG